MSTTKLMSDPSVIGELREALRKADYTVDGCLEALGPMAYAALARSETVAAERATRGGSPVETLIRLFLLQERVPERDAARALPLDAAVAGNLLTRSGDEVQADVDIRPYGEADVDWWLVSDLGAGLVTSATGRERRITPDYVLGVGGASTTLAQLTVRDQVTRSLDLGTGCGVQALHLARHSREVVATDRNLRALEFAGLTAALSLDDADVIDLRAGDLFEPVDGERFDLIVSNPPFVVSPESAQGSGRYTYRDSGLPGDEICARLIARAPAHLAEDGWCQVLANWLHIEGADWRERVAGWVRPTGCDAWVVQRELQDPAEYAELWLRDSGDHGTPEYLRRYQTWLDYFEREKVEGIGFGWITLHAGGAEQPHIRIEEITHPVQQPLGEHVVSWFARNDAMREVSDEALLATRLVVAPDVRLENISQSSNGAWEQVTQRLRQEDGLRRSGDIDAVGAAVVGACTGEHALGEVLDAVAGAYGVGDSLRTGALGAVRGLVEEGFLTLG